MRKKPKGFLVISRGIAGIHVALNLEDMEIKVNQGGSLKRWAKR